MDASTQNVAEAFSRKALVYDTFGENHPNLTRMRETVYHHVLDFLKPTARILELNAGTGMDAAFFARHGFTVHATDIAPGMIEQIKEKIVQFDLQKRLTVQQISFTQLDQIDAESFDCIFSNFGGLNCIDDLRIVTRQMARLLQPNGNATWVVMPPFCPWDFAAILKGDWRTATRRLRRGVVRANVEGVSVMTYYFTPRQVIAAFGDSFKLVRLQGLSVFAPSADRKNFAARFPRLYQWFVRVDNILARVAPFNSWGDFFIITLRRHDRGHLGE